MGWCVTINEACRLIASAADSGVTVKQVMIRLQAADRSPSKSPTLSHSAARCEGANASRKVHRSAMVGMIAIGVVYRLRLGMQRISMIKSDDKLATTYAKAGLLPVDSEAEAVD